MSNQKGRGLSREFMNDLLDGVLKPIHELVLSDATLDLEIRADYVNIYYRGGNIMEISRAARGGYAVGFDERYLEVIGPVVSCARERLKGLGTVTDDAVAGDWVQAVPLLKQVMDLWLTPHPKDEREFQQLVVRENNRGPIARTTDYYICDIEYACPIVNPAWAQDDGGKDRTKTIRFDLVAVHWDSEPGKRQNATDLRLALIEMKYADGAIEGTAGLCTHADDLRAFLTPSNALRELASEMTLVFNQKRELRLIDVGKDIESVTPDHLEYIILLANHDPAKTALDNALARNPYGQLPSYVTVRFSAASFMGYGLFADHMLAPACVSGKAKPKTR